MDAMVDPVLANPDRTGVKRPRRIVKAAAFGALLLGALGVTGHYGYEYWTVGRFMESTDDAYVKADFTTIAPKVSGYVTAVLVEDNVTVTAGQVLARIDDRDFRAALDQARADVATAEAAIANIDAQADLQRQVIEQERADLAANRASARFAEQENTRYQTLLKGGYGTAQRAQQAESRLTETQAQLQGRRAGLLAARKRIDVLTTERAKTAAQADRARAALRQAELNLSYTAILAPVDGTVGARALRVGQFVQAGTQLMAVVPLHAAYVLANFKETQLAHVAQGQPVEIRVDGLPGLRLTGHVDSLSPASGLEFALLPPDNATGNFTKIVQRIPVKIVVDDGPAAGRLRAGMSVEPTIDTRAARLAAAG